MKTLIAAGIMALSIAPIGATIVHAEDVGGAIARGAIRGALGDDGYRDRDRDYRRDRYEGRSGYGDCRTVTVERDDGTVIRKRSCD